jgi:hypothetical protein
MEVFFCKGDETSEGIFMLKSREKKFDLTVKLIGRKMKKAFEILLSL